MMLYRYSRYVDLTFIGETPSCQIQGDKVVVNTILTMHVGIVTFITKKGQKHLLSRMLTYILSCQFRILCNHLIDLLVHYWPLLVISLLRSRGNIL